MYYVLDREVMAEKEGFVVWKDIGQIWVPSPIPSMNSWIQLMHYYHIFHTDLFVTSEFFFICPSATVLCMWCIYRLKIKKIKL